MNTLKTVFLMGLMLALLVFLGGLFGGKAGATMAFLFAMVLNFGSWWWSDRIVLGMYGARKLEDGELPWLHQQAAMLAERAGIPKPRLYVIDSPQPNAFATGRGPSNAVVAVNTGLINLMSREEVAGVVAHEIAHIRNRDTLTMTIAAAFAGAIMFLADMARFAAIFGGGRDSREGGGGVVGFLVMMFVAPLAAMLIQMAISRSREYAADEAAATFQGSPLPLASALEKLGYASERLPMDASPATAHLFIVNPLSGGGMMSLFSTHPPVADRVRRLHALAGLAR